MATGSRDTSAFTAPIGTGMSESIETRDHRAIEVLAMFEDAILAVRHLAAGECYAVGPDEESDLNLPGSGLPIDRFPLVRATLTGHELLWTAAMGGALLDGDAEVPLAALGELGRAHPSSEWPGVMVLPIGEATRARLEIGAATLHVRSVPAPRRHPVPLRLDPNAAGSVGISLAAGMLMVALCYSVPPDPHSLNSDLILTSQRAIHIVLKPPEAPAPPPLPSVAKSLEPAGGSKLAAKPPGKMGDPKESARNRRIAIVGSSRDLVAARDYAERTARTIGALAVLGGSRAGSPLQSLLSRDATALGHDAQEAMGGLIGTQIGSSEGVIGGLGIVGTDRGGGGSGPTIGIGGLDGIGLGPGRGPGKGPGWRVHDPKMIHVAGAPPKEPKGEVKVAGCLPKEIIRHVIRGHLNEVKFCYEQGLARQPNLNGRVMVRFLISSAGSVALSSVESSTLGAPAVEQCISGAVRRWDFPKPDGCMVNVSYPFVLRAAGTD